MGVLLEGFTKYVARGRAGTPKVCIRKCGQLAFNSGAILKYDLDVYDYVMLFISNNKNRIAIKLTNNDKESGLIKIQKRPGSFAFSAINFLKVHDIDYSKTLNFDFTWIEKDKTAIFKPKRLDNAI
jgi:hypothetical protein